MLPLQDVNHVAEGLGYILGQYKGDPGLKAMTTVLLRRVQDAEDMFFDVLASQLLTTYGPAPVPPVVTPYGEPPPLGLGTVVPGTAQGQASGPPPQGLLQLADLVQCPVGVYTTAELAFLLGVWLLARKSKGRAEDLIGILAAGFGPGNFSYAEYFPAAYRATVWNVPDVTLLGPLSQALEIARPPGVAAALAWGTWPTATFFLGDSFSGMKGSGLKDSVSGTNAMGLLSSIEE